MAKHPKTVPPESHGGAENSQVSACGHGSPTRRDYLLLISSSLVGILYACYFIGLDLSHVLWLKHMTHSVYELVNTMWWGVLLGVLMLAVLSKIPKEFVMSALGTNQGLIGILRATAAGVLLDMCSHGILMVGSKLYRRGASAGQVMAFLIASPWNSFSLTFILFTLVGAVWTLTFVVASMLIAICVGVMFDKLVMLKVLPGNANLQSLPKDFDFWFEAKQGLRSMNYTPTFFKEMLWQGIKDSKMVVRWILFGVVLASLLRTFLPEHMFEQYFGPTLVGMSLTIVVATVIEVCSEGSAPIAADLLNRAAAPGNGFAFLMTGVSTDYTEVMVLRDTTGSWKMALFLPLLTVPQVLLLAWIMNGLS